MHNHDNFKQVLNHKWLINLSSFILLRVAFGRESEKNSYRKSSWVLPVNKYDLAEFFPSPFFIYFLVSIFKTPIDFNFYFLTVTYIFNIFKNEFLVSLILFLVLLILYALLILFSLTSSNYVI